MPFSAINKAHYESLNQGKQQALQVAPSASLTNMPVWTDDVGEEWLVGCSTLFTVRDAAVLFNLLKAGPPVGWDIPEDFEGNKWEWVLSQDGGTSVLKFFDNPPLDWTPVEEVI